MMRKLLMLVGAILAVVLIAALVAAWLIDPNDYRDEIAARATDQLGRQVELSGPMALKVFPWLAIEISEVGVGNPADFGQAPPLARIGQATASVRLWPLLRGELEIGSVTLEDADIHLVSNRAGRSNLDGLFAEDSDRPAADPNLSGLSLGELRLRQVRLITLDQARGEQTVVLIERLKFDPFRAGQAVPFRFTGRLSDNDQEQVRIDELRGDLTVATDLSGLELSRLVGEFRLAEDRSRISLRAGMSLDLTREPMQARIPVLDLTLAADAHRIGLRAVEPLSLSLGDPIRAEMPAVELSLNEQPLSASGRVSLGDPIRAELNVTGEQLDLRPFMAGAGDGGRDDAGPAAEAASLAGLELTFGLDLQRLLLTDALTLSEVVARASLVDERLLLDPLDARLLGGQFHGRVSVDFSQDPPQVRLQPRLAGVRIDELVALSGSAAPVRGLGDVELDLGFSGFEPESILASLAGSGRYQVADGALVGVDLRQLVSEGLSRAGLANISRAFGGQTEFEQFSGQLAVSGGVVELPDLNLVAGDLGLIGNGRLELAANRLDYRLELNLGPELVGRLPRSLRDATGGRIPLSIVGPMTEPVVSVDVSSLAERALRQQLEQRLLGPRDRPAAAEEPAAEESEREPETDTEAGPDAPAEPERRERTRDVLVRGLLNRREREREREPEEPGTEAEEAEPEEEEPPPVPA